MTSATEVYVLSNDTLDFLSRNQIDGSVSSNMRRIRKGILRDSCDKTTWNEEIEIPVIINSVEALQFIGMKKAAARQVLERFQRNFDTHNHPTSSFVTTVYDLIDFAVGHLEGRGDAVGRDDNWLATLKSLGIKESTRTAICNPSFDEFRYTKTAKEWAQETLRDGFLFLSNVDKKIQNSRERIERDIASGIVSV